MEYLNKSFNKPAQFINDKFILKDRQYYKSNKEFEKDMFKLQNNTYNVYPEIFEYTLHVSDPLFKQRIIYDEDEYNIEQYGDIEFLNWLKLQKDPSIAFFAEIIHAPKLKKQIELIRPIIKHMNTISINEYCIIKKIGSRKKEWLKQLKKKYGNYILKFLLFSISLLTVILNHKPRYACICYIHIVSPAIIKIIYKIYRLSI